MKPEYLKYSKQASPILKVSFFVLMVTLLMLSNVNNDLTSLTMISVISFIVGLLSILKYNNGTLSLVLIFYIICYFFHCSYFILISTNNICGNVHMFITLTEETQINTLKICNYFFLFFSLGVLLTKRRLKTDKEDIYLTDNQCCDIGKFLMACCVIPRLYVDIRVLFAYLQYGYDESYQVYINNYIILIANLFYIGALLCLYGFRKDQGKAKKVLIVALILIFIGMMSGHRVTKVGYLVILLFLYYKCVERKQESVITKIKNIFLCYLILAVLATVGDLRETGTFSIPSVVNLFIKNFTYKLIIDQLSEFGYAAYTLGATLEYTSSQGYGYGENYIFSWLEVLPNLGGALTGFSDKMSFVLKLPSQYQHALGGSLIAEFYYNFGFITILTAPLLGHALTLISNRIDSIKYSNGLTSLDLLCLLIIIPAMLWIRSTFNEFPRAIVWFYILIYMVKSFMYKKSNSAL